MVTNLSGAVLRKVSIRASDELTEATLNGKKTVKVYKKND
jgi:hypothetical protein